jgi:type I restriction enzyme R subunit
VAILIDEIQYFALFRDELGYRHLGDWTDRAGNSNIEEGLLSAWLADRGYSEAQISMALYRLHAEADNLSRTLYANDQAVYSLLRFGVPVKIEAAQSHVRRRQGGIIWHTQGSGKSIVMVLLAR